MSLTKEEGVGGASRPQAGWKGLEGEGAGGRAGRMEAFMGRSIFLLENSSRQAGILAPISLLET